MEEANLSVEIESIVNANNDDDSSARSPPSSEAEAMVETGAQVISSPEELGDNTQCINDATKDTNETTKDLNVEELQEVQANSQNVSPSVSTTAKLDQANQAECCGENIDIQKDPLKSCDDNRTYYVKWISWKGVRTAIVTQNDNGPCPLLAIINILLLRRAIQFPNMQEMVTTSQLMEYLGDHVLKEIPENLGEGDQLNFEQNMQDVFSILPKLKTGLDVNVKFTGVGDFEFTPECVIFDLLNIHLYHGWLVDPQNIEYKTAIGGLSYNQLVEKIIAFNEENKESQLTDEVGLLAESFLQDTANQLTYHGLCELNTKVKQDELCVFFRNNHFSTLYKHQNELFLLLTDQGFLTEDQIVWQTLSNVDGDGVFVDNCFKSLPMKDQVVRQVTSTGSLSQEDQDYMLALSIQNEDQPPEVAQQQEQPSSNKPEQPLSKEQGKSNYNPSQQELLDLQFAMHLQEEENQRNQPPSQQQPAEASAVVPQERRTNRRQTPPPQQPSSHQPRENQGGKNCVIL